MAHPHTPEHGTIDERIHRYLHESGLQARGPRVVALTGDASDRLYFRVVLNDAESVILAVHPGPIDFSALPFANVADLLDRVPWPVPDILGHSNAEGIVEVSDLGDVTLQAYLESGSAPERRQLYQQAVELIALLQQRGRELASDRYLPYRLAFDVEKLTFELNFFVEHFVETYRGATLSPDDRDSLAGEWQALASELASEPRVLCHRDYHSRNLMVRDGQLYVIDFQDARMGPDTYDLASLLRDAYVDLTEDEVGELLAHFPDASRNSTVEDFRRRFDLMSLQRNLKALGTFGYQTTAKGSAAYLPAIPRTLRHVRTNLMKYPRFARLHRALATWIEELR